MILKVVDNDICVLPTLTAIMIATRTKTSRQARAITRLFHFRGAIGWFSSLAAFPNTAKYQASID
jgi:hypothetical protein